MPKTTNPVNHRVVIEPETLPHGWYSAIRGREHAVDEYIKDRREKAEAMVDQIKRHVDGVGRVYVDHDDEHTCSYCGSAWTEDSDAYNGGCCAQDEEHNPEAAPTA